MNDDDTNTNMSYTNTSNTGINNANLELEHELEPELRPHPKCEATKQSGLACENKATYEKDGRYYCGVRGHGPADKEILQGNFAKRPSARQDKHVNQAQPDTELSSVKPSTKATKATAKAASTALIHILIAIFNAIILRIEAQMLPEGMEPLAISSIMNIRNTPNEQKMSIMYEAVKRAGSRENLTEIMRCLPEAINKYELVSMMVPISPHITYIQYAYMPRQLSFTMRRVSPTGIDRADTVCFDLGSNTSMPNALNPSNTSMPNALNPSNTSMPNTSITIMNLNRYKPEENDNYIYMGAGSIWFIPLETNRTFRAKQNLTDASRILNEITNELKCKYLNLLGKTLGCHCVPHNCHCEVYVMVIAELLHKQ